MKSSSQTAGNEGKKTARVLCFIFGWVIGAVFLELCFLIYKLDRMEPVEKQFYQIKGYWKLDQYQKADIRDSAREYEIGLMIGGIAEEGMKTMDIETARIFDERIGKENESIDLTDFKDVSFDKGVYQIREISRCNCERYEELGVSSKDIISFGRKDTLELYFDKKGSDEDCFIVIINANGNMFFVPPAKMRTNENGDVYWMAYPLYLKENTEEEDF